MSTESGEGYCSALRSYFLTFMTLLWREASISINWSKWLNTCPTRSWPWQDAFHKLLCSSLLNLPFGNHSKEVSLSEIEAKNQSWKQYGRWTWARWKWELERSTCRVYLCWNTPTPTTCYLAPHLNNREEIQLVQKSERTNMAVNCIARSEKQYFWCLSDWFGADEKVLNAVWQAA